MIKSYRKRLDFEQSIYSLASDSGQSALSFAHAELA